MIDNDVVKITRTDNVDFLQFKRLLEYKELVHCFTLKRHNVGFYKKISEYAPGEKTYKDLKRYFNIIDETFIQPTQKHTDNILVYTESFEPMRLLEPADGVITADKYVCSLTTEADCLPMFIYDPIKKVYGNIHSGWRGTVQKIGVKAIKSMIDNFDCNPEEIICGFGPSIRQDHFLIKEDVKQIYEEAFPELLLQNPNLMITADNPEGEEKQYKVDNVGIYKKLLTDMGLKVENLLDSGICTYCENEEFHSYRFEGDEKYRSNASIMMIKNG